MNGHSRSLPQSAREPLEISNKLPNVLILPADTFRDRPLFGTGGTANHRSPISGTPGMEDPVMLTADWGTILVGNPSFWGIPPSINQPGVYQSRVGINHLNFGSSTLVALHLPKRNVPNTQITCTFATSPSIVERRHWAEGKTLNALLLAYLKPSAVAYWLCQIE